MARPVEIDREHAFITAFGLFWDRGYRATSIQHLLDAMAIGKSSFYAAFGSKDDLFRDVLTEYQNQSRQILARVRAKHRGIAAIHAFVNETLIDIPARKRRRGCLAVNSAIELAGANDEFHGLANEVLSELQAELQHMFKEAATQGEISSDRSPRELAQLFVTLLQGLRVSSRRGISRSAIKAHLANFFELITNAKPNV